MLSPLKKLVISTTLCCLLALGVTAGPRLLDVAYLNFLAFKNPTMFNGQVVSGNFAQLIIDFIMKQLIDNGFKAATETRVADSEKNMAAERETVQAEINYSAALKKTDAVAQGSMNFPADVDRACRISQEQVETQNASLTAHIETKSWAITSALDFADGGNASVKKEAIMKQHNEAYCSVESLELKRCEKLSTMPDADIQVTTLLTAEEGDTMTKERHAASRAFINMVTDPIPPEDLPVAFEKSAEGQRFLLERRKYNSLMSMSRNAYIKMLAARTSGTLDTTKP